MQHSANDNLPQSLTGGHNALLAVTEKRGSQNRVSGSYSAPEGYDQSPFTPGTLRAALDAGATFGMEPTSQFDLSMQTFHSTRNSTKSHDPIEIGLISRPCAQILFEGFFEHFNTLVGLLDPQLYSFTYTRSRSSLLFTVVLAVASRAFQPQSHKIIRDHSEALLGKALLGCNSTIEIIWAIICIYHWKDANDKRGEILIGFASQMAAYAEWNKTYRDTSGGGQILGSAELQLRQERDRERVLAILYNIERRLTYINKRLSLTSLAVQNTVSHSWIYSTEFSYCVGDLISVSSYEMTNIVHDVYESMTKFEEHHDSSPKLVADFESLQNAMNSFNNQIDQWGDQWYTIYSNHPNLETLQRPIALLQRDYTCLYFNIIHLDLLLESDDRSFLGDQIAHTTCICFSSAFGMLQRAAHFGEMNVIYYLWDDAHKMIAYAAMLIPRLLAQGINEPTMLKQEAALLLDQVTTAYLIASKSMGSQECHTRAPKTGKGNKLSTQARLLSALLEILNGATPNVEDSSDVRGVSDIPFIPDLPWLEEDQTSSNFFSEDRTDRLESQHIDFDYFTFSQPEYLSSSISQGYEESGLLEDVEFLESMYLDAGLLPSQKLGILVRDS
ncbi:hypothetical protein FLAG1_09813 [Fusarium langsethiae]|uniref:Transcription factor domain-containing protein n=1 Tax=Fusarium langsethiae TaxID=179993 RepID=A0A0M9EQ74_FUSLA|nr:hypothetical protein FLAG1_09813 [Fusarium langsethiae]